MVRFSALVAALICCLFVSFTAAAQDGPRTDYPSGFVIADDTPCYALITDAEPWTYLAANTDALIYTDPSEPWVLIGVYPDENNSRNSCWVESTLVSPGMGTPATEVPTEEPTTEPTALPETPEVVPPTEVEPTEVVETPAAEPTESAPTEVATQVVESEEDEEEIAPAAAAPTEAPEETSTNEVVVTILPVTGSGPDSDDGDFFSFVAWMLLAAAGLLVLITGAPCYIVAGIIDGYRDYKEGFNTPASRAWARVIWFVRAGGSTLKRAVLWALNALWLYPFGAYVYYTEHRGQGRRGVRH